MRLLMGNWLASQMPALGSVREQGDDAKVIMKYYHPTSRYGFHAIEYDPEHRWLYGWFEHWEGPEKDEMVYKSLDKLLEFEDDYGIGFEYSPVWDPNTTLGSIYSYRTRDESKAGIQLVDIDETAWVAVEEDR